MPEPVTETQRRMISVTDVTPAPPTRTASHRPGGAPAPGCSCPSSCGCGCKSGSSCNCGGSCGR